MIADRM
jgi:hypothetical protein